MRPRNSKTSKKDFNWQCFKDTHDRFAHCRADDDDDDNDDGDDEDNCDKPEGCDPDDEKPEPESCDDDMIAVQILCNQNCFTNNLKIFLFHP